MVKKKLATTSKQSNKGLQTFTDFDSLKSREAMLQFKEERPNEFEKLGQWLVNKLNEGLTATAPESGVVDKFFKRLENYYSIYKPEILEENRRSQWQINKSRIEKAINSSILNNNRLPSHCEIAEETGLSRVTVGKHLKEGFGSENYKEEIESYKIMTPRILNAMYKMAIEQSNLKAMKIFLDYFKDGNSSTVSTIKQQNNYLQFNNTRIDEVTVNNLPEEARLQIEGIIKQYQKVN